MKINNPKVMIPLIRKAIPNMIAKEIVGVQPMTSAAGEVFKMKTTYEDGVLNPWTKWRKTTSIWPRRSVNGKLIFGRINKRSRNIWDGPMDGKAQRKREFATDKELFRQRLKWGGE
jgi:hypothetical protein